MRHFDAHAYRTEDYDGVKEFARGCLRTYLILKDKASRWNEHPEFKTILAEIADLNAGATLGEFDRNSAENLLAENFDRAALAAKGPQYERLDQLTMDILFGVD